MLQVVKTGLDVLVVVINLRLVKCPLLVQTVKSVPHAQQLLLPIVPVAPLVSDVLLANPPNSYKKF